MKKFRTFRQQVTWLGRVKRGRPCGRWGKCWYFFLLPVFVLIECIQSTYLGICYKLEPKRDLILMRIIWRQDILTFWQGPGSGKRVVDGWLASQRAMAELQVLSFNNFSKFAKKVVFTDWQLVSVWLKLYRGSSVYLPRPEDSFGENFLSYGKSRLSLL